MIRGVCAVALRLAARAACALGLLLAANAALAAPVLDAIEPTSGAAGTSAVLRSPDVVAGRSYFVFVGVAAVAATATADGALTFVVPPNLCAATYPVALIDAGARSNGVAFQVTAATTAPCSHACLAIVPDAVVVCPYRAIDSARHDLVFLGASDGRTYAASAALASEPADPVLDPFVDLGWLTLSAVPAPGGERLLAVRRKPSCPTAAPGPGLACSYGRNTIWLALHWPGRASDPDDDFWVHLNLAPAYGLNSQALNHPAWLHERMAIASLLVRANDGGWISPAEFHPQLHAIRLSAAGFPSSIATWAAAALARPGCLTGRIQATPSQLADACSPGQRVVFTRRCESEPDPSAWTWWNSTSYDAQASRCVADETQLRIPILRTYVTEVDAACEPALPFESMQPVREPPRDALHRQMGRTPEWGDMEPSLSPDGRFVAVTTTTGNPLGDPANACLGFSYNLADPARADSGTSARRIHVCELETDGTCAGPDDAMTPIGAALAPPESQLRPAFVGSAGAWWLVFQRQWSQLGAPRVWDLARVAWQNDPDAIEPLAFAPSAAAPEAIPLPAP